MATFASQLSVSLLPHESVPKGLRLQLPPELDVPSALTRRNLSELVNSLLKEAHDRRDVEDNDDDDEESRYVATPFEFTVKLPGPPPTEVFLRTSLGKFYSDHGISPEARLVLYYIESLPEPETLAQSDCNDWLASVTGLRGLSGSTSSSSSSSNSSSSSSSTTIFFTGGFDNVLRAWKYNASGSDGEGKAARKLGMVSSGDGHSGPVKGVACASVPGKAGRDEALVVTASKDQSLMAWKWDGLQLIYKHTYSGHLDSVEAVAIDPLANLIVSGGWDNTLKVWATDPMEKDMTTADASDGESRAAKRRRKKELFVAPRKSLEGHTGAVHAVTWPTTGTVVSASADHSVRLWDVESAVCSSILNADACVLSTAYKASLVAGGLTTGKIALWDARLTGSSKPFLKLGTSSTAWVSGVSWLGDGSHLVSSNYAGEVKVWDVRSTIPLFSLQVHHENKAFGLWSDGEGLVASVGADCHVALQRVATGRSGGAALPVVGSGITVAALGVDEDEGMGSGDEDGMDAVL